MRQHISEVEKETALRMSLESGLSDTTIAEYTGIRPEDDEESVQALSRDW